MHKYKFLALAAAAAFSMASTSTSAATVTAVSTSPGATDFTITFTDDNANNLLDIDEITGFSGISLLSGGNPVVTGDIVLSIDTVAGISVGGIVPGATIAPLNNPWAFADSGGPLGPLQATIAITSSVHNYSIDLDDTGATPVPLPAGLPLLLAGVGGLGLMAQRKRKAA